MKENGPKKMLDDGPFGGNPTDPDTRPQLIVAFDEIYASAINVDIGESSAEGYRATDPHRPALTAHTENLARTWGARLFGERQK